jgi:hypothetical protein
MTAGDGPSSPIPLFRGLTGDGVALVHLSVCEQRVTRLAAEAHDQCRTAVDEAAKSPSRP